MKYANIFLTQKIAKSDGPTGTDLPSLVGSEVTVPI